MLHSMKSLNALVSNSGYKVLIETGVQRYGLANHMYWLTKGSPGGHVIWENFYSQITESSYKDDLVNRELSDTLWLVAKKLSPKQEADKKNV